MKAKEWILFRIEPKAGLLFFLAFVLFTIVGTLSHEGGHILVAKSFGNKTHLSYGSMGYRSAFQDSMGSIYERNKMAIDSGWDFQEKERFHNLQKKVGRQGFFITLGGPLQTMLTGCLGLFILYWRRTKRASHGFHFWDWTAVFLSLFWLRESFNLVHGIFDKLVLHAPEFFGNRGDEVKLDWHLNLPSGTFPISLGLLGLSISCWVIFKVIPVKFRFTFILSGMLGGLFGFWFWFNLAGPVLFN